MIINNSHEFIFVHIPKTAGTSVTSVLSQLTSFMDQEIGGTEFGEAVQPAYAKRFGIKKHSTAGEIRAVVGEATWNRYFSFSFVRNPFARSRSTFHFLREWSGAGPAIQDRMRAFSNYEEFVLSGFWDETTGPDDIFLPQFHWLRSRSQKQQCVVDFVGTVENLAKDLRYCVSIVGNRKIAARLDEVPVLNTSNGRSREERLSVQAVDRVLRKYEVDFKMFGYSTEPLDAQKDGSA